MFKVKGSALTLVCALVLALGSSRASATRITFNFDGDTPGTFDNIDTVGGLSLFYFGAATVCDASGQGFTNISGNALATGACDFHSGSEGLAFSHPVTHLTFDYAISDIDPIEVEVALFDPTTSTFIPQGTITLDDNGGTFEGSRSFAGRFDTLIFDTQGSFSDYALDNISVTPVPEPSSLILVGTGMVGFAGVVRRRFSK